MNASLNDDFFGERNNGKVECAGLVMKKYVCRHIIMEIRWCQQGRIDVEMKRVAKQCIQYIYSHLSRKHLLAQEIELTLAEIGEEIFLLDFGLFFPDIEGKE